MNIDMANKELENKEIKGLLTIKRLEGKVHIETALAGTRPVSVNVTDNILFLESFRVTKAEVASINSWGGGRGGAAVWFGYKRVDNADSLLVYMPGISASDEEIKAAVERLISVPANVVVAVNSWETALGVYKANPERIMFHSGFEDEAPYRYNMDSGLLERYISSVASIHKTQLSELLAYFQTVNAHMFGLGLSSSEMVVRLEGAISGDPAEIKDNISRMTLVPVGRITLQIITLK